MKIKKLSRGRENHTMKWFKHMTNSSRDTKLSQLWDEFGPEGYGAYWRIRETIAEQLDDKTQTSHTLSVISWSKICGFSVKKFQNFAEFSKKMEIFEIFQNFSEKKSENLITINFPELLQYQDEWQRKKNKNSGVTPEKLRSKEENKNRLHENRLDKNITPLTPQKPKTGNCLFEKFWVEYPKKVGKAVARRHWQTKQLDPKFDEIMAGLKRYIASDLWMKEAGRYILNPATFLNQERWEDVIANAPRVSLSRNDRIADRSQFTGGLVEL